MAVKGDRKVRRIVTAEWYAFGFGTCLLLLSIGVSGYLLYRVWKNGIK